MAKSAEFPVFVKAEYDGGGKGFAEFNQAFDGAMSGAVQKTRTASDEMRGHIRNALTSASGLERFDFGAAQLRNSAQAAQANAVILRQVASAAAEADGATSAYAKQTAISAAAAERHATALNTQAVMLERLEREARQVAAATGQVSTAMDAQTNAAGRAAAAHRSFQTSMGASRMAGIQLGQQAQDFAVQVAGGQNVLLAFTQQASQAAFVAQGMGGVLGRVGAVLSGPYGTAIFLATTALGVMTGGFTKNKEAADAAKKASEDLASRQMDMSNFFDLATGAIREQNRTLIENAILLKEAKIDALRDTASGKQAFDSARSTSQEIGAARNRRRAGVRGSVLAGWSRDSGLDEIIKRSGNNAELLDQNLRELAKRRPDLSDAVLEVSRLAAAAVQAGRDISTLEKEIASHRSGKLDPSLMKTDRDSHTSFGRDDLAADIDARLRGAGMTITSGYRNAAKNRQVGGQANSYHLTNQARDIAKTAGVTMASIRAALPGVEIKELIDEGDHFHVAWSGALRGISEEAREAEKASKELEQKLRSIVGELDPARAAADEYAAALARIAELARAGKAKGGLSPEEAELYRYRLALKRIDDTARAEQAANRRVLEQYGADIELATDDISDRMVSAGRAGAQAFHDEGLAAAQAIAQVFGGKIGGVAASILGLMEGSKSGNYNSVGGKLGGALTLLSAGSGNRYLTFGAEWNADGSRAVDPRKNYQLMQAINPTFGDGFRGGIGKFGEDLTKQFGKVFGNTPMSAQLGQTLGSAFAGAQFGGSIGKGLTDVLGVKGSKLGSQLGGAIGGAVAGPIGSIVGGILGSVVGGAFKKTPTGSATIGVGANGELVVTGLSGSSKNLREAANDNAGSALTSIERIAEALGATVNASRGSVSIGFRDKNARVDVTGSGITKTSRGAIDFGSDVEAAVKYATLDLIKDGVLEGLRAGTQRLLTNAKDLEAGLDKALKFESIFTRLKSYTDPVGAALDALDKEFKNLMKIATEAGASSQDMADLEKLYGIKRKEAIEEAAESTIGSLREMLRDLTTGDNGRSLRDRRAAAYAEFDPLRARVAAGDQTAYDAFAAASQALLDIQRQISGSGADYFALLDEITALTKSAISGVENVTSISAARDSIFKAADLSLTVDNAPVTSAIDRMAASIVAQLSAANQNQGTMIELLRRAASGGGGDAYFSNIANF